MSEEDFKRRARRFDGINVVYYPPAEKGQRPILQTLEVVRLGDFRVSSNRWTDGGSIPSIGRVVAAPLGYLFIAFLIHDTSLFDGWGWSKANSRFNTAMKALEAPAWQRLSIIAAVKGNATWQHTKAKLGFEGQYV